MKTELQATPEVNHGVNQITEKECHVRFTGNAQLKEKLSSGQEFDLASNPMGKDDNTLPHYACILSTVLHYLVVN